MRGRRSVFLGAVAVLVVHCKASDVLNVPPPATQFGTGTPSNQQDAEAAFNGAKIALFQTLGSPYGLMSWTAVLTDEFTASGDGNRAIMDARFTSDDERPGEWGDTPLQQLYQARSTLLVVEPALRRYEPDSGQSKVGEAYALVGYIELHMAEYYCAGMTLSYVPEGGGIVYGQPLTTDSLLGTAEAHFDSALAHAHGSATVRDLASVGLGRARLDRAHYAQAAAAVTSVPTAFAYNVELVPQSNAIAAVSLYADLFYGYSSGCAFINVSDREGANGLDFVSARDQRLVLDSTVSENCGGYSYGLPDSLFYYPTKFGNPPTGLIPLATGVEARLIEAEAALASNAPGTWASDLNALRAAAPSTYLALSGPMAALTADSTTGADAAMQVDVMFRERAFWLFGTGTRLGDMRRLIRNYHRDQRTVFPTGPYVHGNDPSVGNVPIPSYGSDVSLTLPTTISGTPVTNPYYRGCLTSPRTA